MTVFDAYTDQLLRFLLVLARVASVFSVLPVLGQARTPGVVKVVVSVALAAAVSPVAGPAGPVAGQGIYPFAAAVLREVAFGLAIGFAGHLVFSLADIAGEMLDYGMGFGLSGTVDPMTNLQMPVIARFLQLLASLVFLTSGAHHIMIAALVATFRFAPPGAPLELAPGARPVMDLFVTVFAAGIKIAGPIVGVLLLCDLALGMVARTSPQMNLLMVGLPLKIGAGIAAVAIALPVMGVVLAQYLTSMDAGALAVARAMAR